MADLTSVSWVEFPARPGSQDAVSPNFRVYELTKSELAQRLRIENRFARVAELRAAVHLCRTVLQPLRDEFGRFSPNSVYRSQALERALKRKPANWQSGSQHCMGEACDVEIPGMATLELAQWAAKHLEFDQIICECYDAARGSNSGWVHISRRPPGGQANRRQLLSYVLDRRSGKFIYAEGLRATGATA